MNRALNLVAATVLGGLFGYGAFVAAPGAVEGYLPSIVFALTTTVAYLGLNRFRGSDPAPTQITPATPQRKSVRADNLVAQNPAPKPPRPQPIAQSAVTTDDGAVRQRIDYSPNEYLEVVAERQDGGLTKFTVTATGFTGSRFKVKIRPHLNGIKDVTWSEKNLGDRVRQFEAVVPAGKREQVLAAISKKR